MGQAIPASTAKNSGIHTSSSPSYGIIYNWDGAPHEYSQYPQSLEEFLEKVYAPIKGTQVGALFWCLGTHEATWVSQSLEMVGDSVDRVYDNVRSMREAENIRTMLDRGDDPYGAVVKRGRELGIDVFASIRINDNHFWNLSIEDMPTTMAYGLTKLRKDHPEWCLGDDAPNWATASWNLAIPEVREHILKLITEACHLAKWDGVELDWQRHAVHLPANNQYRLRYTLTDLQRAVRRMTNEIARVRGKPFPVAVRVATTIEGCHKIGYDIESWVEEKLCDIVVAGGTAGTDPTVEIEEFKNLLYGTGISLYPGYDFHRQQEARRLISTQDWRVAWFRALSAGFWERGVDGIYVFNWHANAEMRRPELTTIGNPLTLQRTNKVYSAIYRKNLPKDSSHAGTDTVDRIYGETPVTLYRTLTNDGPKFQVPVYDHVSQEANEGLLDKIELHIEFGHYSNQDEVQVTLDGLKLGEPMVCNVTAEDPENPSEVDENSWLIWQLDPDQTDYGRHEIQVKLVKRDTRIRPPLVISQIDLHITYVAD